MKMLVLAKKTSEIYWNRILGNMGGNPVGPSMISKS